jgi:hypothetical protein
VAWVANSEIQQAEYFWALLSEQRAAVREKVGWTVRRAGAMSAGWSSVECSP